MECEMIACREPARSYDGDRYLCERHYHEAKASRLFERSPNMTRCKFKCDFKKGDYVTFSPVYSGSEENKSFFKATPGGTIQLHVVNEQGMATFEEGAEYYIDFTKTG